MECVVVKQPWASLVVAGKTRYLVRTWRSHHRGRLTILAGSRFPRQNVELCCDPTLQAALREAGFDYVIQLPLGAVVGAVMLRECKYVIESNRGSFEGADPAVQLGLLQPGLWVWVCDEPEKYARAVPMGGKLGIFKIPEDIGGSEVESS